MEREKLWIYILQRPIKVPINDVTWYLASNRARYRYVDRLTKAQRGVINLIRLMEDKDFIQDVGGKTYMWRRGTGWIDLYIIY